ncbi:restriction endonuclease subunit S [Acinetobacter seifertii]|uniref:restriction endonuclease subunit S n=1 Tax=Acinetobacter seifertii TaxID=1530123 RepID=UPI0032B3AFF5
MAKYQKYIEYKDSGVEWLGEIPKHWQSVPSRGVVEHIVEKNSDNALSNYLSLMANIGVIRYEDKGDIGNKKPEDLSKCKIVRKGQLVINSMNYSIGSYGMSPYDGICSPVYIVLQSLSGIYLERFALRIFENSFFQKYLSTFGNGILEHRAAINWDDIKGKYVPLPPLIEQENILNFLDYETAKIDGLIAKQEKLIELLKEKRQTVISHAVTKGLNPNALMKNSGVEWLGEVPEHWRVCRLKHVGYIQSGIAKGKDLKDKISISVPMLRVANVQDGYLNLDEVHQIDIEPEQLERYLLQNGDVLMNEGGDNDKLGRGAVWRNEIKNCIHQNHVFAIRTTLIEPEWLDILTRASYAKFHFFRQSKQSTNLASISVTNIKETPILVPPKNEREQILSYLNKQFDRFSKLENRCYQQIELLKERRTALISSAVTGKIDVRHWQNSNKNNRKLSA